jgi:molybdopterin-guanine dinucleotide biosynthesis protein A
VSVPSDAADPADPAGGVRTAAAAIVLAGGRGERLGGVDKGALEVGGRPLLDRALAAVRGVHAVVVAPPRSLPPGVLGVSEQPPGGGPAAGVAAGFVALQQAVREEMTRRWIEGAAGEIPVDALILVLAVDHPGVTPATFARLVDALPRTGADGAALVQDGRRQYGVGVYSAGALRHSIGRRPSWHGVALRLLLDPLVEVEVPAVGHEAADVDTPEDLRRWCARSGGPG